MNPVKTGSLLRFRYVRCLFKHDTKPCWPVRRRQRTTSSTLQRRRVSRSMISNNLQGFDSQTRSKLQSPAASRHREPSCTRYKGTAVQSRRHWGAQIYDSNRRLWLGTFRSEEAAALAYDRASLKLGRLPFNFPISDFYDHELNFIAHHTTHDVLGMIKDGSYEPKLAKFTVAKQTPRGPVETNEVGGVAIRELFRKELTRSDVGKLCRFVVHKKYAEMHFPHATCGNKSVTLKFFDKEKKPWTFRMCYWPSSQSYVLVKGWKGFVKRNDLKEKDVIVFYECKEGQGEENNSYRMIRIFRSNCEDGDDGAFNQHSDGKINEEGEVYVEGVTPGLGELDVGMAIQNPTRGKRVEENALKKGVWLFGVKID